jgi:hypothetical protein
MTSPFESFTSADRTRAIRKGTRARGSRARGSGPYEYWDKTEFKGDGNAAHGHWKGDLKNETNAVKQATDSG